MGEGISKKGQERRLKWYGHVMEGRSTTLEGGRWNYKDEKDRKA